VRDSVARSEQVLAIHDRIAMEVAAIEMVLPRKDLKRSDHRDSR
jgi:hypothetical protein